MSTTYQPGYIPDDAKQLPLALSKEFAAIKRGAEDAAPSLQLQILHAAPARLSAGLMVYADGVDFNPGSGEGVYVRDKANAAWRYLG